MPKKNLAFVLFCSDEIAFLIGNIVLSINKYSKKENYDIVIFYKNLSEKNQSILTNMSRCSLYRLSLKEKCLNLRLEELTNKDLLCYDSFDFIALFESFDLLDSYKTVIFLGHNIIIQSDISKLSAFGPFGLVKNIYKNRILTFNKSIKDDQSKNDLDCIKKYCYSNSLMVISDALVQREQMKSYCYKKLDEYVGEQQNMVPIVLSLLIRDFAIQVVDIPWHDYMCHVRHEFSALAKIVYFGIGDKFWSDDRYLKSFPEWFRTHLNWLELGGDDFDRSNMSTKSVCADLFEQQLNPRTREFALTNQAKKNIINITLHPFNSLCLIRLEASDDYTLLTIFGVPLLRICRNKYKIAICLLKFLEIFKIKKRPGGGIIYILGIPLFRLFKNDFEHK